jgi:3-oxoacyl-[acyl-carrier protein] reductase
VTNSALILGGGGGIGAAICTRLARTHAVAVGYLGNDGRADEVVARIRAMGRAAETIRADASTENGVAAAFAAAERLGTVRTVVHCVGSWDYTRVTDLTEAVVERDFATNLKSALLTLAASAGRVVDGGRVVLLSSAAAPLAPPRQASYAAMKAGLEAAARVAAKEFGTRGITVNIVRPGAIDTERLRTSTAKRAIEAMATSNALGRLGTPDDIARVVDWIASEDARWITAGVIDANGGLF